MVLTALTKTLRTMQKKTEGGSNPDEIKAHVTRHNARVRRERQGNR
jgi:hypothetical protein